MVMVELRHISCRHQHATVVSGAKTRSLTALVLATFALCGPPPSTAQDDRVLDLASYEQTFTEDFDSLDVSAWGPGTRWIAHTPYNGDFGDGAFANPVAGFPFTIENGVLRIEARKDRNGKWHSGLLSSVDKNFNGFTQQDGYFEIRAKLPAGEGAWPAFWLLGRDRSTTTPEVDVLEHYGHDPGAYEAAVHIWDVKSPAESRVSGSHIPVPYGSLSSAFHTFGVSIEPDLIRYYFDRREVWNTKTIPEHRQPMYLLIDLAVGGGWPITNMPNPSFMYVDYVRAWRRKD
jgi:beta-glucanase (GH16 family)